MSEAADTELEERVSTLEKKLRRSRLLVTLSGVLGALLALLGNWLVFEAEERNRRLKLTEIRATHIRALKGDYDQRYHAFRVIAAVHGVEAALDIEPSFRSGATIRALDHIREIEDCDRLRKLIEKSLDSVPRVLVIDSQDRYNVYCESTRASYGTNVDDISALIKDFSIRLAGRKGDVRDPKMLIDEIIKMKPDVIIMHMGAFELIKVPGATFDDEKTILFIKAVLATGLTPDIIIYSRQGLSILEGVKAEVLAQYPEATNHMALLEMKNECFTKETSNGQIILKALRRVLQIERLYSTGTTWPNK